LVNVFTSELYETDVAIAGGRIAGLGDDSLPPGEERGGAIVVELLRGSPADRAGVEPGDIVIAVDGRTIDSAAQLRNELAQLQVGSQIRLTVVRNGRRRELRVPVEESSPEG